MKRNNLLLLVLSVAIASTHLTAQLPLPCLNYTPPNASGLTAIPGDNYSECLKIESGTSEGTPVSVYSNNTVRWYVGNGEVEYDTNIEVGENGEFSIIAMDRGNDEREELQGAWFEPTENYYVPLYEKVEWGVRLPYSVQERIDNFIYNTEHPNETPHTPVLNPYDPEQIDLWADVDYSGHHYRANGFYYVPFERHTVYNDPSVPDPDDWYWEKKVTDMPIRIRFSPDVTGNHVVQIHCVVPGMGEWSINPFRFDAMWNDPAKSFIIKSANGHYYATADNKVFFPVGQNLAVTGCGCELIPHPFGSEEWYNDFNCEECYSRGTMSPCCGLDAFCGQPSPQSEYRHEPWRGEYKDQRLNTNPPAGFMNLYDHMKSLAESGGNTAKIIMTPMSFDFEFEKLNNYYARSHNAWELDYMLELCRDLDLRVQLCLNYHPNFGHGWANNWDWTDLEQRAAGPEDYYYDECGKVIGRKYRANCYYNESEITGCTQEPISFFSSPQALHFYKKKIRYFIARYGYSSRITDIMLMTETNNIGVRNDPSGSLGYWASLLGQTSLEEYKNGNNPNIVGDWNIEIMDCIKNSLGHTRHLLGTGYTGLNNSFVKGHCDPLSSLPYLDQTWYDDICDVISYSSYNKNYTRWRSWASPEDEEEFCSDWRKLDVSEESKIIVHSEQGISDLGNDIEFTVSLKDNWANAVCGFASSGFNWGRQFWTNQWQVNAYILNYFQQHLFSIDHITEADLSTEYDDDGDHGDREMLALVCDYNGNKQAVGMILNKSWNPFGCTNHFWPAYFDSTDQMHYFSFDNDFVHFYNNPDNPFCDGCIPYHPIHDPQVQLGHQLKVDGLDPWRRYRINYFKPRFSQCHFLESIEESWVQPMSEHHLKIGGYPELDRFSPFVLFTISPVNERDLMTSTDLSENLQPMSLLQNSSGKANGVPRTTDFSLVKSSYEKFGSLSSFKVFNLEGQQLYLSTEFPTSNCFQFLSSGIYLVEVSFPDDSILYSKIVVVR